MIRKIYSLIIVFVFALTGLIIFDYYWPYISEYFGYDLQGHGLFGIAMANLVSGTIGVVVFGGLGMAIAPSITNFILGYSERLAVTLSRIPTSDILVMVLGIGLGLIIANLIGSPFAHLPIIGPYVPIIFSLILSVVGAKVALRKHTDIVDFFSRIRGNNNAPNCDCNADAPAAPKMPSLQIDLSSGPLGDRLYSNNKLLDTSVIIDGRVMDIMAAGFLDGKVVVPNFVLEELQKLSDSSDSMKRAKGRRGLDLVQDLQHSYGNQVLIVDYDFDDLGDVDSKLVRLAKQTDSSIMTNDFNLNKVAEIQGIKVLNINELANAIKPVVISGEEMSVYLVKEGKEPGQAVAYLDDGTMIVVENGRRFVGSSIEVTVTSVLQTAAGRMIFARANHKV
ncbi:MAG: PIN/TRAM domain-containing protein [Phascolarctobacterium sp.]|nr:PIN/TRAM domain-containing protein [Acidaminococcaceae bacterium]MBQ7884139.1 PIN/TRAM domain-containing protein [Phascolarctobacterium sp.]